MHKPTKLAVEVKAEATNSSAFTQIRSLNLIYKENLLNT